MNNASTEAGSCLVGTLVFKTKMQEQTFLSVTSGGNLE